VDIVWQLVLIVLTNLISVIITGATFWLSYGRKLITKDEVEKLIDESGPYVQDRQYIQSALSRFELLGNIILELKVEIVRLRATLEHIEKYVKLD
jgi:hypothetical protein